MSISDNMGLSSFKCFSGGLRKTIFFHKSAFWPFKVIQSYQLKVHMRLPIRPS